MTSRENAHTSEEMVTGHAPEGDPVSNADRASSYSNDTQNASPEAKGEDVPPDEADPSLDDLISNAQWVWVQKQQELLALTDLAAAETDVAKQSVVVTGIATLAAFVFSCFCWLIANIGIALTLHHFGVPNGVTALIVFMLNLALAVGAFLIARNAYRYVSLMPAIRVIFSGMGIKKENAETGEK